MFNLEKYSDKLIDYFKTNPNFYFPAWMEKTTRFFILQVIPFATMVVSFLVLIKIFTKVQEIYGQDRLYIILTCVVIFAVRNLGKAVGKLNEKFS